MAQPSGDGCSLRGQGHLRGIDYGSKLDDDLTRGGIKAKRVLLPPIGAETHGIAFQDLFLVRGANTVDARGDGVGNCLSVETRGVGFNQDIGLLDKARKFEIESVRQEPADAAQDQDEGASSRGLNCVREKSANGNTG